MTVYFHMKNGDVLGIDDIQKNLKDNVLDWLRIPDKIIEADMGYGTFYFRSDNVLYISFGEDDVNDTSL